MSPERDENGDGANEMHYPSPGTEAIDPGPFYHGRDDQQPEHMEGQQPGQDQQQQHHHDDGSADVHGLAEDAQLKQDDATAELQHHHQQQPDPSTPQQQQNARPANIEELQLAAQLGQGLAGTPMMPAAEANMSVEDASLRNIMPHPEPDNGQHGHQHQHQQTPTYNMHDTSASDSIMAHGLQQVAHQLAPHYNMASSGGSDGGIPPRKRSKVSRACDECRRKKIKCDAQTDTGDAPCSSCARSNIRCLFSRIPQKRGPSKGYIKELADRIHSIENKLDSEGGLTQEDLSGLFGDRPRHSSANNIGGGPGDDLSRKRPYSSISGGADLESPISSRHTPWAPDGRPLQSQGDQPSTPFDSSSLAPQPVAPPRLDDANKTPVAPVDTSMDDLEEVTSVDEGVLQE